MLEWNMVFCSTFNLLVVRSVFLIGRFYLSFFSHSVSLYHWIGMFRPYTLISNMIWFNYAIFLFLSIYPAYSLLSFCSYLWINLELIEHFMMHFISFVGLLVLTLCFLIYVVAIWVMVYIFSLSQSTSESYYNTSHIT